jgi:hypothetical protein
VTTSFVYQAAAMEIGTSIIWDTAPIYGALLNDNYGPSLADQWLSDIPSGAFVKRDLKMTDPFVKTEANNNTLYGGTFPLIPALSYPAQVISFIIYQKLDTDADSRLIYYSDAGFGFPFIPKGFGYQVSYDLTFGGFFQLVVPQIPRYFTSRIYPIQVIESYSPYAGMVNHHYINNYADQYTSGADFLAGTITSAVAYYTDWPVEQITVGADFLSGSIALGSTSYTYWPTEAFQILPSGQLLGGSLQLGLVQYTNWPPEPFTTHADFLSGTLT